MNNALENSNLQSQESDGQIFNQSSAKSYRQSETSYPSDESEKVLIA
jgi:hypothetical protein